MLQEVSDEMKGDHEVCTAAVAQDWRAHKYASKEVQKEKGIKAFVMKAVTQDWTGLALEFVSEEKKG